jgi:conjugative transfer region lipoprotein (TIGR03751 family)
MAWTDLLKLAAMTLGATTLLGSMGCTTISPRESPLPREGATMSEIYRAHMNGAADSAANGATAAPRDRLPARALDDDLLTSQRRAVSDPVNERFQRLPNPDLTLYVFSHLAQGRYPVPGYSTVFPMYETVQYALPGEVAPRRSAQHSSSTTFAPSHSANASLTVQQGQPTESGLSDAMRKGHFLTMLERLSPFAFDAAMEYDRLYEQPCSANLSTDQLIHAVQADHAPAFGELLAQRTRGAPMRHTQLIQCDVRSVAGPTAAASPSAASGVSRREFK